ncbi:MAG: redoxin domain-containing protein [Sedimentisphaerales bacterium]|jgi:peroxiredoxin|nr:redoxin domain-containing protein [Sedimentisphaerales bacterium]
MQGRKGASIIALFVVLVGYGLGAAQVTSPAGPNTPLDPAATSIRVQLQSELQARINTLKAEQKALLAELYAILDLAEQEKATKTAERILALIRAKQADYQKELNSLETRLNRLKRALSEQDKQELLTRRAGTSAPLFQLTDQDGKTVRLSDYRGKVVVLEWIDPNCPFWRYHVQRGTLKQLAEEYKDKGVVWLAINSCEWSNRRQNQRIVSRFQLPYPVLDDHTGRRAKEYVATNTPYVVIIGPDGLIAYNGAVDNAPLGRAQGPLINYVQKALSELLEGKTVMIKYAKPYGTPIKAATGR